MPDDRNQMFFSYDALATLLEAAETQQETAGQAVKTLTRVAGSLPLEVSGAVERQIASATISAAQAVLQECSATNEAAVAARQAYEAALRRVNLHVVLMTLAGITIVICVMIFLGWLYVSRLTEEKYALETRIEDLKRNVAELERRGGKIILTQCQDTKNVRHICLRGRPIFDDYVVPLGY